MPCLALISASPERTRRVAGFFGAGEALAVARFVRGDRPSALFLARDALAAAHLAEEIPFFAPDLPARLLPDWETLPYDAFAPPAEAVGARAAALAAMLDQQPGLTIAAAPAALGPFAPPAFVAARAFAVAVGGNINPVALAARLARGGYARVHQVRAPGEFAVRGGQLDFFPAGESQPLRVVLFDDEVEEVRTFDPETQRSTGRVQSFRALPAREFDLSPEGVATFCEEFNRRFGDDSGGADGAGGVGGSVLRKVRNGEAPPGAEHMLPMFFGETARLFDYLPDDCRILMHDDARGAMEAFLRQARTRQKIVSVYEGRPAIPAAELFLGMDEFFSRLQSFPNITLEGDSGCAPPPPVTSPPEVAAFFRDFSGTLIVAADGEGRREMLESALRSDGVATATVGEFSECEPGRVNLAVAPLRAGFCLESENLAVLTETEIFQTRLPPRSRRVAAVSAPEFARADDIREGDLVAHQVHGIGRFLGMKVAEMGGVAGEYLELEYAEDGRLWLPVSQLGSLRRHHGGSGSGSGHAPGSDSGSDSGTGTGTGSGSGKILGGGGGVDEFVDESDPGGRVKESSEAPGPALSKLGSSAWRKARAKAAKRARDTAARILEVAARRASKQRTPRKLDAAALAKFAAGFPHPETPDQARAAAEALLDLEREKPMDRLLAADVGFGKTEVAMRAACAVALCGEQAAILAPTTLLASQHYRTFSDRFAGWPIRVGALTRHVQPAARRAFLQELAAGTIDIAVGTHALLGRDVKWKKLGLAVIDEEHRFGVRQKERCKEMRADVDVLALSATPIPRSLSLSLEGVRDFSVMATPPAARLPVRTLVAPFSRATVAEACERELLRGGQVFFVHNEIRDMESAAERLGEWLPRARIAAAHGGMTAAKLESAMRKFLRREADVLLCTTIVESGLDIANANTLVVDRADRMGISRLHQLRGRVGRSRAQAFAYFLTPPAGGMTRAAEERLSAIASHSELGGGFHLAMRDLEIRGAGEALGERQSGEMDAVGYGVFHSLLKAELKRQREGDVKLKEKADDSEFGDLEAAVDLGASALLPSGYVSGVNERLRCYRKLSECEGAAELFAARGELEDRFGKLPPEAELLLESHRLRLLSLRVGATRIRATASGATVTFVSNPPCAERLLRRTMAGDCRALGTNAVRLPGMPENPLARARKVADFMGELAGEG